MIIGICDDEAEGREQIRQVCEVVLKQMGCPAEIALFEGASFVLQTSKKPDILILDIEMPGMTGIELKEVLQSEEGATYIIFVTDHEEMMTEAFGVHVLRFVQKENLEDKLPEALAQAIRMKRSNCIVHGTDSQKILYIYSDGNYIRMVTEAGEQPLIREPMKQLKKELERIPGNSIVVVQDEEIVKVHVHTLKPGEALNLAQRFGEFVKLKIENMQEQANNLQNAAASQESIVGVDDKNPQSKREAKETAIISVCAGQGVEDAFLELHCDYVVSGGQTMNPSTEDMVAAVKEVNAKNVIILPNNSNIVMTAQQTATILEDEVNVIVIPTKTIPQGLSACVMYNPEASLEDNIAEMEDAVANVKTGQVTFAIKDTNIDGVEIKANDYMALVEKDIVACKPNKLDALKVCLEKLVDEDSELITLLVGEDVVDEEVEEIESYIEDNFDAEVDIIEGKQPVYSFIIGVE